MYSLSLCFHCLFAYASNHLSVNLLPVWRPQLPCINHLLPCYTIAFFLLCNHNILTPVHPSVFILYNCMVLRLSCLLSQSPYHRNQSPVHLPKHADCISSSCLSVCVLPPFPTLPLSHIPPFAFFFLFKLLVVLCSCLHK